MEENVEVRMGNIMSYGKNLFRKSIKESWKRCIEYGLTRHDEPKNQGVSSSRMQQLLEKHKNVLELAHPYIKSLSLIMSKSDYIIGIGDKDGVLLHIQGEVAHLKQFGYQRGYIHLESYMGTNALGTCIETRKPIIIWGEEHFLMGLKEWAGFAAPIYMQDSHFEAVLFLMMPVQEACRETMVMVSIGANSIGKQLQLLKDKVELMDIHEMMQEARNSVMETASIISHEVRNSLTNISAYIQLLQLDRTINNYRGDKILREIARVNRLLDDFKLLSGNQQTEVSQYSLDETLQWIIDIMRPKVELNNIDLIYNAYNGTIYIKADKNALHHVFINLIDNAIQAMEDGGTLRIDLEIDPETEEAIISFEDTGPGIPPDQIKQIFELFHTTKKTGSGLGLHICQTIVKYHGGNIEVKSAEGKGATFIVRLPVAQN